MFRGAISERIQSLLHISQQDIYDAMNFEKPPMLRGKTKWEALQDALAAKIPINNRGEIVYLIAQSPNGYKVYSEES